MNDFQIIPLNKEKFAHYFFQSEEELKTQNIILMKVSVPYTAPCRVSLEIAHVGEEVILLSWPHQNEETPYKAKGPIFIKKDAVSWIPFPNKIPLIIQKTLISVRGYDEKHFIIQSEVVDGSYVEKTIKEFFSNKNISYLHLHFARPGCYACRVERV